MSALKPSPFTDYGIHFPVTRPHSNSQSSKPVQQNKRNSANTLTISVQQSENLNSAFKEADKMLKHAQSAINFDDVDTAVSKLSAAIAVLLPYTNK